MIWEILTNEGRANDIVLYYRYAYYVLGDPLITDGEYDELEQWCNSKWTVGVWSEVGSSKKADYPLYVREGRRPTSVERWERDEEIKARWMRLL